jgi:D-amino-acid dehydrogenase
VARHQALAKAAGVPELIRKEGLLLVYPSEADYRADSLSWALRRANDVQWRTVEGDALAALCPGLAPRYRFGIVFTDGGHCTSPGRYVAALSAYAATLGVRQIAGRVTGFARDGGAVSAVRYAGGAITCDGVVIAGGLATRELAALLGDKIPLVAERGYHVQIDDPGVSVPMPVMMSDLKIGITPMVDGLRGAGQVEFARRGSAPDDRRAKIVLDCMRDSFPGFRIRAFDALPRWMGTRPSTPDCMPVIGPSPNVPNAFYAGGHGHLGLVSAPYTAELVASLVAGTAGQDIKRYDPTRFQKFRL